MPEGDTIYRTARHLQAGLAGGRVHRAEARGPQARATARATGMERLTGHVVEQVEPRGKHLLIWFAPTALALHTHLGMHGTWHLYRPGQRWRKPAERAMVALAVADRVAVCFAARVCELLTAEQVTTHPTLAALGPDVLAAGDAGTDLAEARRRLDQRTGWTIGEALLDQRVIAGIGNVYKSEVLFAHRIDPWAHVEQITPATRDAVLATGERLLRANVAPGAVRRTTTGDPAAAGGTLNRLHVYGRAGRPCLRCAAPVRVARQGEHARTTYWCPHCQEGSRARGPGRPTRRRIAG